MLNSVEMKCLFKTHDLEVIKPVNHGSFGTIYYARNVKTLGLVALKVVFQQPRTGRNWGPVSENECEIQSTLDHVNIVKLLEYWKSENSLYLTFEWLEGNLSDHIIFHGPHLDAATRKGYMIMLLKALSYLHGNSIVHRDVKPQNILLNSTGVLKLGDFGLARRLPCNSLSSTAGTRNYRAPEMLFGSRNYDTKVDVWACGCVCAEIYIGRVLLQADSDIAQLALVVSVFGAPEAVGWKSVRDLPDYGKIIFPTTDKSSGLPKLLPNVSLSFLVFLDLFLTYDPAIRCTVTTALESEFLSASATG